jgi:nucleoid-associated protein YgaU
MRGRQPGSRSRAAVAVAALVATVSATAAIVGALLGGPVREAWSATVDPVVAPGERLAAGVLVTSALILGVAGCWLVAAVAAELLEQVRRPLTRGAARSVAGRRPQAIRSLVALLLGSALAVPLSAGAEERPGLPVALDGLPLPDRLPERLPGAAPGSDVAPLTLRVHGGDSLWGLASDRLPAHARAVDVDRAWRHLYARNREAVGPDPDLLLPGTLLRVPRHL